MRKSILAMFVAMIAIFAVACGGNTAKGNGGDANAANGGGTGGGEKAADDAMAFFKKAGNYYVMKSVTKMGSTETVSGMKMEITKSDDKGYTMKTTVLDKDMKPMDAVPATENTVEWPKTTGEAPKCAPKVEIKKETIKVAGKDLECMVTEVAGTKSWSYKGMPVKSHTKNDQMETTSEVTEFKCE